MYTVPVNGVEVRCSTPDEVVKLLGLQLQSPFITKPEKIKPANGSVSKIFDGMELGGEVCILNSDPKNWASAAWQQKRKFNKSFSCNRQGKNTLIKRNS